MRVIFPSMSVIIERTPIIYSLPQPPGIMTQATAVANPYALGIARFVAGLTCDAIPADVRQRAKLLMLDAFGCALYGADLAGARSDARPRRRGERWRTGAAAHNRMRKSADA